MSLYTEAAGIIKKVQAKKGSVKSLVLSRSSYPNKKQLYALVCETLKNSELLTSVAQKVGLLEREETFGHDEHLLQVLLFDELIGRGIKRAHSYRIAVQHYRSALKSEYKKQKEELSSQIDRHGAASGNQPGQLPRYARINLLKTTVDGVIDSLLTKGWSKLDPGHSSVEFKALVRELCEGQFMLDPDLPDLLVFRPGTDLHNHQLTNAGHIILQDKASCFPAHILCPPCGAEVLDCCAAPGNKTSHVASLTGNTGKIFAFDKDARRLSTMRTLVDKAGVTCAEIRHGDFLNVNPKEEVYQNVEYILVDPSCTGSGIASRVTGPSDRESSSEDRLASLSRFQIIILKHALKFPKVKRVVYSTCSIHPEENEMVVDEVFDQVSNKFSLKTVVPEWKYRGQNGHQCQAHCIRMSPEENLTNGFFIACFERKIKKKGKPKGGNLTDNAEHLDSEEFVNLSQDEDRHNNNDIGSSAANTDHKICDGYKHICKRKKISGCVDIQDCSETNPAASTFFSDEDSKIKQERRRIQCGNMAQHDKKLSILKCGSSENMNNIDESKIKKKRKRASSEIECDRTRDNKIDLLDETSNMEESQDSTVKQKKKKKHRRSDCEESTVLIGHGYHDSNEDCNHCCGNKDSSNQIEEGKTKQKRKKSKKAERERPCPPSSFPTVQSTDGSFTTVNSADHMESNFKSKHKKKKKHKRTDD